MSYSYVIADMLVLTIFYLEVLVGVPERCSFNITLKQRKFIPSGIKGSICLRKVATSVQPPFMFRIKLVFLRQYAGSIFRI